MQDMTQGSIPGHLGRMAAPIAIGMLFQTLYYLIDLYFVAQLGDAAIAGVSAAGNAQFIVMALTQVLGVGTMALIAHAVGRKDREDANLVFNQSLGLAALCAVATATGGYVLAGAYMRSFGADAATIEAGMTYLYWFAPGMALQFALVAMGSALRGTGIAKPTLIVQLLTVIINAVLAPVLIAGWGTGKPMGVAGAGLATSLAVAAGVVMLWAYFSKLEKYVAVDTAMLRPRLTVWKRILAIGIPPGGEFALLFVYMAVIYWVTRGFGADAQAGFGVGGRVMQAAFLPAMAVAFATAPVAGQNVGAGRMDRVRATFRSALIMGSGLMLLGTLVCQWDPALFVRAFTTDPEVVDVASVFLSIISWNFVANGIVFTCSGMFQALGNTLPALLSGASRLLTFALPAIWLSRQPGFTLKQLWWLSFSSMLLQALLSLWLVAREFRRRALAAAPPVTSGATAA